MRKMKLGAKIGLGFGLIMLITLALGGLAIYSMNGVAKTTDRITDEYVPELEILANLNRYALTAMDQARAYSMSRDNDYYDMTLSAIKNIGGELKKAKALAQKYPGLQKLASGAAEAERKLKDYKKKLAETKDSNELLSTYRNVMNDAFEKFINNAQLIKRDEERALAEDLKAGAPAAQIQNRVAVIGYMNQVLNIGSDTNSLVFKALYERSTKGLGQAVSRIGDTSFVYQKLEPLLKSEESKKRLGQIKGAQLDFESALKDYRLNVEKVEGQVSAAALLANDLLAIIDQTAKSGFQEAKRMAKEVGSIISKASWFLVVGLLIALAVGVLLALVITISITRPINVVITGLNEGASQVDSASTEVSNSSQSLAEGASQQAASLEQTSASLEEMNSMTRQNADNAGQADGMMKEASQIVSKANVSMGELKEAMDKINTASDETAKIIKTIDEIAFQTNLLALNAAVEAARAGEAGAGFAVVADEVRNLAMRAAEAARNTSSLIEENIKDIKQGSELVVVTDEAFKEVQDSSGKVAELVGEIAAASSEQSQGIEQINKAMSEMDKVTQRNAATAEESAAAAEELSAQSATMQGYVNDLVGLVGSTSNKKKKKKKKKDKKGKKGKKEKTPAQLTYTPKGGPSGPPKKAAPPSKPPAASAGKGGQAPGEEIPFDDDEFKDF